MSDVYMTFQGLDEIMKECERLGGTDVIDKTDRALIKKCAKEAQQKVSSRMPRSQNVSNSGRKGSRTFTHSADAVPITGVRRNKGKLYSLVGWDRGDNSPYFYTKFNEWGTSTRPPNPIFLTVSKEINQELRELGLKEYTTLLNFLEE